MIKRRRMPPPDLGEDIPLPKGREGSKFDSLSYSDLFLIIETSLSKTTHLIDGYPHSSTKMFDLGEIETTLEAAVEAVRTLQGRVAP